MENKVHEIKTIQDIANVVTTENIDDFMKDLRALLLGYMSVQMISNYMLEKAGKELKPIPIPSFKWTDDGIVDVKIKISAKGFDESIEFKIKDARTDGELIRDGLRKFIIHMNEIQRVTTDKFVENNESMVMEFELTTHIREDVQEEYYSEVIREKLDELMKGTEVEGCDIDFNLEHKNSYDGYNFYSLKINFN